jgi:hypothetical protein
MTYDMNILDFSVEHQQSMFKIEILPVVRCTIDSLPNTGSVVRMSSLEHEIYGWLIGSVAFEDAKGFLRPVQVPAGNTPAKTARVAQPLRCSQIGFAALQFGGPFRHLRLEFVAGFAKLSLALA